MSEFGNRYKKPRIAVICHQFERKKMHQCQIFLQKKSWVWPKNSPEKRKKTNKHRGHQIYIFDFSISGKKM